MDRLKPKEHLYGLPVEPSTDLVVRFVKHKGILSCIIMPDSHWLDLKWLSMGWIWKRLTVFVNADTILCFY